MKVNGNTVIDTFWGQGFGLVLCQDNITKEFKCYARGLCDYLDEETDIENIVKLGGKFPLEAAKELFRLADFTKDYTKD